MDKEIKYANDTYNFLTLSTYDTDTYSAALHLYKKYGFQLCLRNKTKVWLCIAFNLKGKLICYILPVIFLINYYLIFIRKLVYKYIKFILKKIK